ncbi:hypothetical protein A3Q56_00843 [Intoshia linei]|uniref:Uncharacterized protein n=1 Tax=Intoshia linei TaxID=1819745 RepID=A0A177BCZ0_9BILA|nr:hypothetical protein A3Q56_00843 [Intoshia linei]
MGILSLRSDDYLYARQENGMNNVHKSRNYCRVIRSVGVFREFQPTFDRMGSHLVEQECSAGELNIDIKGGINQFENFREINFDEIKAVSVQKIVTPLIRTFNIYGINKL